MKIYAAGSSDLGMVRDNNEDSFLVECAEGARAGLFVVADGVGGSLHGEVASKELVEQVRAAFLKVRDAFEAYTPERDHELRATLLAQVERLMAEANEAVYRRTQQDVELSGMCTTAVVLILVERGAFLAHVGDSRAYLFRQGTSYQLTEDHNFTNQSIKAGLAPETARALPFGKNLARVVGRAPQVEADCLFLSVEDGDRFLLCSDGLTNHLETSELLANSARHERPADLVDELIRQANGGGGTDNITAIAVRAEMATSTHQDLGQQISLLRGLYMFQYLNDQEIMRLMRIVYPVHKASGEVIVTEGADTREAYIPLEGWARVSLRGESLTRIGPGSVIGEMSLLDNYPRSATVVAEDPMRLLMIDQPQFYALIHSDHQLASKLLWSISRKMAAEVRSLSNKLSALQAHTRRTGSFQAI